MNYYVLSVTRLSPLLGEISDTVTVGADSPEIARLTTLATWPMIVSINSIRKEFEDESGNPLRLAK